MRSTLPLLALALAACQPAAQPPESLAVQRDDLTQKRDAPGPLEASAFKTPTTETRTLSNGLQVVVANNPEVPLVSVTLGFRVGSWNDDITGQAAVTFDMLNEGAGELSSEQLSSKLKAMASDLGASAGSDGSSVSITSLKRNLEPTLDLMALVVQQPTFPSDEWSIMQRRYVASVKAARKDPNRIANRVYGRIVYGDTYRGRVAMEADYEGMTTEDMRNWYGRYVGPENAILLVGGDITADEVTPMLEARFGTWTPEGIQAPSPDVKAIKPESAALYLVDKPGAAQSVVRAMTVVGRPTDDDWFPYSMGVDVLGGSFMSRLNMNLREDKGYTYGARCSTGLRYGDGVASCGASVKTAVTGESLVEIEKELSEIRDERPISADELDYMKGTRINGYPRRFETSGALLGEQQQIWRYGLPADWPERYLPSIEGVSLEQAQGALGDRWDLDRTAWLVVGDKATVLPALKDFGLPVIELDADGNRIGE